MSKEPEYPKNSYKCPHCGCMFFSKADLQQHLKTFGEVKSEHEASFRKVHGRLEHGYEEA